MQSIPSLDSRQAEYLLTKAAQRRFVNQLTCRDEEGWSDFKTRFLKFDRREHTLLTTLPKIKGSPPPPLARGDLIHITFRHGPKKCLFNAPILEPRCRVGSSRGQRAIKLGRPERMIEIQRRVFNRVTIPPHISISANLYHLDADQFSYSTGLYARGYMLDLSAGGACIALRKQHEEQISPGTQLICEFRPEPHSDPIPLACRVRHTGPSAGGKTCVGLQFMHPPQLDRVNTALKQIIKLTASLSRIHN